MGGAPVVLVGADCVAARRGVGPPRRPAVHVLGRAPVGDELFRTRWRSGAETVAGLPASETWLVELLTDVGDGGAAPGVTIGVIGGSGGAGATVFAAALGQVAAGVGPTLLVDADPIGPGIDRVLGLEARDGIRWDSMLADDWPAQLALVARGAAAARAALGADLAHRPAGLAAGLRDARGALGRAAGLRRRGASTCRGTATPSSRRRSARCDHVVLVSTLTVPGVARPPGWRRGCRSSRPLAIW